MEAVEPEGRNPSIPVDPEHRPWTAKASATAPEQYLSTGLITVSADTADAGPCC